jgi:hypothetical protein
MSETEDRWYVNVGSDDVRMMTLDELVDAFEKGVITQDTLVVEVGGNEWQPLKEVADLGDEDPVPAAAPVQHERPAAQASWPPQAVSRESAWPPASAWPSVMPAAAAKQSLSSAPLSAAPNSTIPVVQDLDFDVPPQAFKSGKKNLAVFAILAVALAGGAGFAISKSGGPAASPVPVPAAAAPMPRAPTPYSKPETTTPSSETKDADDRLSDEQKKALLTADKDRDEKKRTRSYSAPRTGGGSAPKTGGAVFKANGNANDPLNPTL